MTRDAIGTIALITLCILIHQNELYYELASWIKVYTKKNSLKSKMKNAETV